jgi:uncharacterized protein (TIGR03437 family)
MKRLSLVLLLAGSGLWAQDAAREQARRQDLEFVATRLPELHLNFFNQLDRAVYERAARQLDSEIPTLSDTDFYVRLAQMVAMAGDAHTYIYLNGSVASSLGFQQFPMTFRWLDDGIFVTSAAQEYSRALAARLVRVGGVAIEEVVEKLATVIPHSNPQWVRYYSQQYLRSRQVLQGVGVLPAAGSATFGFRTLAGEEFTLDLTPGDRALLSPLVTEPGPLPYYLTDTNLNYWFTYSAPLRLLYFKYNACSEMPGYPFAVFADALFKAVDGNPVDTLVIDFRGNGGGNSAVIGPFFLGLQERFAALIANPEFRLYGVIDKGTFSSGMRNAMDLKTPIPGIEAFPGFDPRKRIRVVGEPTGGAPTAYGNVLGFTLPASKLQGQYSTKFFTRPAFIPDDNAFVPDLNIAVRSTDFFARYDPVLAAILARTDEPADPPQGNVIAVNGATFRIEHGLAPGSYAAGFGAFGSVPEEVLVNGEAAKITGASVSQLNFVVPASLLPGRLEVSVRGEGGELARGTASITAAAPGIFPVQAADPSQPGAVLNQDSTLNSVSNAAAQGSIVQIFATGHGPVDAAGRTAVAVYFGDRPAEVVFSGPVAPGLWQINARVPQLGVSGQVPVWVIAGAMASNAVTVRVR